MCSLAPCQILLHGSMPRYGKLYIAPILFLFVCVFFNSIQMCLFYSGLERLHPREWPKIGLDFAERTLELFSSQKVASPFLGLEVSPLRPLVVLRCALADLHTLRSKFYMHISLEDFTQVSLSCNSIFHVLNHRIYKSWIQNVVLYFRTLKM